MAAPSGTVWGSVSSNGKGKLGIYVSASTTNTTVTLTVQVWLALKYNISDSSNSYTFAYTNDSGGTSYGANGTSLSLSFGITSGSGWSDSSQKQLASYTLSYTRGTAAKSISLSSSLKNLGSDSYSVSVSTSYTVAAKPSYTVSYNANGGSGAPSSQTKWYGTNITLSSTKPTRTGYTFLGWSTSSSATSATYAAGATYSNNASATLYAVWKIITYTVSYNANGGSGAPSSQTKTYGATLTLSSTVPTRTGYTFLGWSTSSSATSATYAAGGSYTSNASATLYAVWRIITYTVSYNANGGSGAPSSQTKTYGVTLTLSTTVPTRSGYNFAGWGTASTSTTPSYAAGGSYTSNASITLYAVWSVAYVKPYIESINVYRCNSSGTASDEGTYFKATFGWRTFYSVSSITIGYKLKSASSYTTITISASGTSGTVTTGALGSGGISVESSYDIRITVTDSGDSTTADRTISSMFIPVDFLAGGRGLGVGKIAETEDLLDIGFDTHFRGRVYGKVRGLDRLVDIPANSDFNTYTATGAYCITANVTAETMSNIPVLLAGVLEVCSSLGGGSTGSAWVYLRQKYIPYDLNWPTYERDLVLDGSGSWSYGAWYVVDQVYTYTDSTTGFTVRKHSSGLMEVFGRTSSTSVAVTTAYNNVYYANQSITLPSGFASIQYADIQAWGTSGLCRTNIYGWSTSTISFRVTNFVSASVTLRFACHVIGSWK